VSNIRCRLTTPQRYPASVPFFAHDPMTRNSNSDRIRCASFGNCLGFSRRAEVGGDRGIARCGAGRYAMQDLPYSLLKASAARVERKIKQLCWCIDKSDDFGRHRLQGIVSFDQARFRNPGLKTAAQALHAVAEKDRTDPPSRRGNKDHS
jgi:hypothetical protein